MSSGGISHCAPFVNMAGQVVVLGKDVLFCNSKTLTTETTVTGAIVISDPMCPTVAPSGELIFGNGAMSAFGSSGTIWSASLDAAGNSPKFAPDIDAGGNSTTMYNPPLGAIAVLPASGKPVLAQPLPHKYADQVPWIIPKQGLIVYSYYDAIVGAALDVAPPCTAGWCTRHANLANRRAAP